MHIYQKTFLTDKDAVTCEYDHRYKLFSLLIGDTIHAVLNMSDMVNLHYEIESALHHAHEEQGADALKEA